MSSPTTPGGTSGAAGASRPEVDARRAARCAIGGSLSQVEIAPSKERADLLPPAFELLAGLTPAARVIDVADGKRAPQTMFHELVELVQVHVGEAEPV